MTALDDRLRSACSELDAALPPSSPAPHIMVRRRQRRRAASLVAVAGVVAVVAGVTIGVASDEDGTPVVADRRRTVGADQPAPTSDDDESADALGPGSWSGARTSPDGRSLVIVITGGRQYEAGNHCTVDYRAEVTETDTEVRLRILARSPKPSGDIPLPSGVYVGCTAEGHPRRIEVDLEQPLGDRRLIEEQFDREQPVFDGSDLLEPGWLPPGWSLLFEGPVYPGPEAARYWSRTWWVSPPPTDEQCTPSPVTLYQGPADLVGRYPSNGEQATDRYEVRGEQATYFTGGSANLARLAWTEGDRGYVLASGDRCVGDAPATAELLVRIAKSLRQS